MWTYLPVKLRALYSMKEKHIRILFWTIFIFHVITNFIWLITDQKLPNWDPAVDFITNIRLYEILKHPSLKIFKEAAEISSQDAYRPPLVRFLICPFYLFFPQNIFFTTLFMSIIFWYLLFFSVFNLGKLMRNESVGLFACFLIGTYPLIFTLSRIYLLDFPLTAMVALSLYLILLGLQLNSIRYFIILGLVLGLGLLTKAGLLIFVIAPLIYLCLKIFILDVQNETIVSHPLNDRKIRITLSLLITFIISFLYYGFIFKGFLSFIQENVRHGILYDLDPLWKTTEGWMYYVRAIVSSVSPFYFLFFVIGLFSIFKLNRHYRLILLLWILVPYFILTFSGNKDGRYISPLLPVFALISALGIDTFFRQGLKKIIIVSIIIIGLAQFFVGSFGIIKLPKLTVKIKLYRVLNIPLFIPKGYFGSTFEHSPQREDWKIKELFRKIEDDWKEQRIESPPNVLLLVNHRFYNINTMGYCSFIFKKDFRFAEVSYFNSALIRNQTYSYIIYKDYSHATSWWDKKNISEAYAYIKEHPGDFKCIYQDRLPDGSTLYCYKRIL